MWSCCSGERLRTATPAGCRACRSTACRRPAPRASWWAAASLACKLCFVLLMVRCAIPAEGGEAEAVGPEVCGAAAAARGFAQRHQLAAEHAAALRAGDPRQGHPGGQRPCLRGRPSRGSLHHPVPVAAHPHQRGLRIGIVMSKSQRGIVLAMTPIWQPTTSPCPSWRASPLRAIEHQYSRISRQT